MYNTIQEYLGVKHRLRFPTEWKEEEKKEEEGEEEEEEKKKKKRRRRKEEEKEEEKKPHAQQNKSQQSKQRQSLIISHKKTNAQTFSSNISHPSPSTKFIFSIIRVAFYWFTELNQLNGSPGNIIMSTRELVKARKSAFQSTVSSTVLGCKGLQKVSVLGIHDKIQIMLLFRIKFIALEKFLARKEDNHEWKAKHMKRDHALKAKKTGGPFTPKMKNFGDKVTRSSESDNTFRSPDDLDDGIKCTLMKFADDTKLCWELDTLEGRATLQEDLDRLEEQAKMNLRNFSKDKCKVLHLGKHNPGVQHRLGSTQLGSSSVEREACHMRKG
ncbi:rna-directed dna polymerase from mobile element jockey-like [Limosa lapponica baueri]|uniref:Rna-directed dna polymerase from mobile element jockey-like n=1 Tax=Limosa lapponica baueri TaxID=1758121 RepID=A0A2I0U4V3_LIMLA|nr:rna-directed dna polymerase from mobile element jockey-like [Limosa lapponica baueri]